MHPEHASIGELAYRLWQARGCPEGSAEQDWFEAERRLKQTAPMPSDEPPRPAGPEPSAALVRKSSGRARAGQPKRLEPKPSGDAAG